MHPALIVNGEEDIRQGNPAAYVYFIEYPEKEVTYEPLPAKTLHEIIVNEIRLLQLTWAYEERENDKIRIAV